MRKRIWLRPEDNWANTMTGTDEALRAVEIEMLLVHNKKNLVSAKVGSLRQWSGLRRCKIVISEVMHIVCGV
jgi:hypothetical protein